MSKGGGGGRKAADPNKIGQALIAKTDFGKREFTPLELPDETVPPPLGGKK